MIPNIIRKLYAPEFMVNKSLVLGDLPSTKQAYTTAFETAGPSIAETFLISLISMVDTLMVSGLGSQAIAAVGLVTQPRFIIQTPIFALNVAVISIVARRRGQRDQKGAVSCLQQAVMLSFLLSVVACICAYIWRVPFMLFAGALPDTLDLSLEYYNAILLGIPACSISLTICAAQRGIGSTKTSLKVNMTANLINVALNFLLIEGRFGFPKMGVRGAGIATTIGWVCGFMLAVISVGIRDGYLLIFIREGWQFNKKIMATIAKVFSGSFVEQICMRIGFVLLAKIAAGLGTTMFAAHQIFSNIMGLTFCFGEGFGIAASSLVGRSMGQKRTDLSIIYGKACQRMSYVASTSMFVILVFSGKFLVGAFTKQSEILSITSNMMIVLGVIILAQSSQMTMLGSLRGAGDTRYVATVSLVCISIIRPTISYLMAYPLGLGLIGLWAATALDQYLRLFLTSRRFSSGKWMSIKI